jgi:hypothetical protein
MYCNRIRAAVLRLYTEPFEIEARLIIERMKDVGHSGEEAALIHQASLYITSPAENTVCPPTRVG